MPVVSGELNSSIRIRIKTELLARDAVGFKSLRTRTAMSEHKATIYWRRETADFAYESYNRDHDWRFDAGIAVRASAAPGYLGNVSCVDPEEAFVASLSSCHMLTFLAIAARKGYTLDEYQDEAVGVLAKDPAGRLAITHVKLHPEGHLQRRDNADAGANDQAARTGASCLFHSQLSEDGSRRGVAKLSVPAEDSEPWIGLGSRPAAGGHSPFAERKATESTAVPLRWIYHTALRSS